MLRSAPQNAASGLVTTCARASTAPCACLGCMRLPAPAARLDLFFHDASAVSTDERAGNARARELLSDHAFRAQLAAPMIARAAVGCRRLPP